MKEIKLSKLIISVIIGLMFWLVACDGNTIEIEVVIIKIYASDKLGCLSDSTTIVKTFDNRVDIICGYYGSVGDTISGYWTTGSWNNNGFRLSN